MSAEYTHRTMYCNLNTAIPHLNEAWHLVSMAERRLVAAGELTDDDQIRFALEARALLLEAVEAILVDVLLDGMSLQAG